MNLFDSLQVQAQTIVTNVMGYDAVWQPLAGGDPVTGRVLLNKPTQKHSVSDQDYDDITPKMEYFEGQFPGLYESIRTNASEVITIEGQQWITLRAEMKFDGKSIIVHLGPNS